MTITPTQYSKVQRRFLTTLGGLGVIALAAGTFVLSYDDLRLLALRGGAARRWAFLYPWMLDALVAVIILAILTARRSGWFTRAARWLLLVLLIAGAGAAGVQRAVKGYEALPDTWVNVGVAVAPWAILMIAVWLWISMIKQLLSLRARRSRDGDRRLVAVAPAEPVPATVVDQSIIPGLGPGDTRRLPLASSVRELGPAREPMSEEPVSEEPLPARAPLPAHHEPEPNPWDAARIDTPQPWDELREPAGEPVDGPVDEPVTERAAAITQPTARPQTGPPARPAAPPAHVEPSDPVPASWRGEPEPADADDTQPKRPGTSRTATDDHATPAEPPEEEPEPLLPPTRSRLPESAAAGVADEPMPAPPPEAAMHDRPTGSPEDEPPLEDEPAHRLVARTFLPTDVRLVGPKPQSLLSDTNPDGIRLPDTNPDGIPLVRKNRDVSDLADEEDDAYIDERAEDPDAGEDATGAQWEDMEATPPSSKFRSGPMPPRG